MFIFILPALIGSTIAALFTVTTGSNFVIAAIALSQYQKWRGYKANEGQLTEREAKAYYSTKFDKHSDHDLSLSLGSLAQQRPKYFEPFSDKRFDFTKSEGEMLRFIVHPAIQALGQLEGIKIELEKDIENEDLQAMLFAAVDNLDTLIAPIVVYLEQFPKQRVKKV